MQRVIKEAFLLRRYFSPNDRFGIRPFRHFSVSDLVGTLVHTYVYKLLSVGVGTTTVISDGISMELVYKRDAGARQRENTSIQMT